MTVASGCYVDSMDQRAPATGDKAQVERNTNEQDPGACRTTFAKGCFDGYVLSKKDFFVDGRQYFNADDLAGRFAELVKVEDEGVALVAGVDYQLALTTPLDNQSFIQGFEYNLTGDYPRSGKVRTNGNFAVNELPEGTYDLRVQRAIKFTVTRQVPVVADDSIAAAEPQEPVRDGATPAEEPAAQPETQTEVKTYCATIYADTVIEVRKGKRSFDNFGDFRTHITDHDCAVLGSSGGITL
jgi:hypothetical protein